MRQNPCHIAFACVGAIGGPCPDGSLRRRIGLCSQTDLCPSLGWLARPDDHKPVDRRTAGTSRANHRSQGQRASAPYNLDFFDGHDRQAAQNARRHGGLKVSAIQNPPEIGIATNGQATKAFAAALGRDHSTGRIQQFKDIPRPQLFDLVTRDRLGVVGAAFRRAECVVNILRRRVDTHSFGRNRYCGQGYGRTCNLG